MKECIQKTAVGDFCRSVGQNEWVTFVSLWAKISVCLGLFGLSLLVSDFCRSVGQNHTLSG